MIKKMDMVLIAVAVIVGFPIATYFLFFSGSNWEKVSGTVTHFELKKAPLGNTHGDGRNTYYRMVDITYDYSVAGSDFSGAKVFARMPNIISDAASVRQFETEFVVGNSVDVFYDPNDPSRSCLLVANISTAKKVFIVFFMTLIVALTLGVAFFLKRNVLS